METKCHGDLENLLNGFKNKVNRAEEGLKMMDVLYYSVDGKYTLTEISNDLVDLGAMCEAIRSKIDQEKDKLAEIQKKRERLNEVRQRLNHMCYHLPETTTPVYQNAPINFTAIQSTRTVDIESSKVEDKENLKPDKKSKGVKIIRSLQENDFEHIPKHVKGHLSMEQINSGIGEVNHILEKKYEFLKRPRKTLSRADEKKRSIYLEMGKDLKGTIFEIFFMDSDVQSYGTVLKSRPKSRETVFLVLRHLGKMKEIRKGKPPRYCIVGG
ncbi:SKA complex subunit 1-like [Styela clava]